MGKHERGNKRRELILNFVIKYIDEHGYAPSIRDIGTGCDIPSTGNVRAHLKVLDEQGYIKYTDGVARSIVVNVGVIAEEYYPRETVRK